MILLCGIPSEPPMELVREEIAKLGLPYVMFNQRMFDDMDLDFTITEGQVKGKLRVGPSIYRLEDFSGVYTRLMDDQLLPELKNEAKDSPRRRFCFALHDALMRWCEVTPARVVNRTSAMSSNFSKPYQIQLIKHYGFKVPETLVTNNPDLVKDFWRKHPVVIYKSISGLRSIVKTLEKEDLSRLNLIKWCPVQFQEFIEGINVRVHVIGIKVFATAAQTNATDYRYSHLTEGGSTDLTPYDLSEETKMSCVRLSSALKLEFSGIDLKITPYGDIYCLEANPCPGFSYYELSTGQPIAKTLALHLGSNSQEFSK
jgi:glutathione synthase/RimK-type ligase-like ATP-grasp enzyme